MTVSLVPALGLALALLGAPAQQGEPAAAAAEAVAAPSTAQPAAPPPQAPAAGLPRRAPEPRTMAEFWPVFAVLALSWVGIIGYLLVLGRRSGRIARAVHEVDARR